MLGRLSIGGRKLPDALLFDWAVFVSYAAFACGPRKCEPS